MLAKMLSGSLALCALAAGAAHPDPAGQDKTTTELKVKAAIICKIVSYVEWAERPLPEEGKPIHIGILGDDPFGGALDEIAKEHKVKGRSIEIHRAKEAADLAHCHAVFITSADKKHLETDLEKLTEAGTLTVGDQERFAERGGVINLVKRGTKIRFDLNTTAAREAGIRLSSHLIKLATVVEPDKKESGK